MSTKVAILKGTQHTEPLHVDALCPEGGCESPACDALVDVRPLTDVEQEEVTGLATSGQQYVGTPGDDAGPSGVHLDVSKSARGQMRARRLTAAYGLSTNGERWSEKEVGTLPTAAVAQIAAKVDELTGGDGLADKARTFRGERRGAADSDPAPDGQPADPDAG